MCPDWGQCPAQWLCHFYLGCLCMRGWLSIEGEVHVRWVSAEPVSPGYVADVLWGSVKAVAVFWSSGSCFDFRPTFVFLFSSLCFSVPHLTADFALSPALFFSGLGTHVCQCTPHTVQSFFQSFPPGGCGLVHLAFQLDCFLLCSVVE